MDKNDNALTTIDSSLGLSPDIFSKLESYDDYVNFYIQLEEASSGFSWMKADLLLQMEQSMGEKSLREFSKEVKQPLSTITNYIRVSKAFEPEQRDLGASFSLHFQASFADSYNEDDKAFTSDKRFEWLEKAMDENMSTRQLASAIQKEKQRDLISDGDENAMRKQEIREVLNDIQKALSAIVTKANNGSSESLQKLQAIKEYIYGKDNRN